VAPLIAIIVQWSKLNSLSTAIYVIWASLYRVV